MPEAVSLHCPEAMKEQQSNKAVVFLRSNEVAPDPRVENEARILSEAGSTVTILGWDRGGKVAGEDRDYARIVRFRLPAPYGARFRNVPRKARWNLWLLRWLWSNRRQLHAHPRVRSRHRGSGGDR